MHWYIPEIIVYCLFASKSDYVSYFSWQDKPLKWVVANIFRNQNPHFVCHQNFTTFDQNFPFFFLASTLAKKFISQKLQKGKEKSKSILAQAEQILLLIHAGVANIFFLQPQLSLATYRMWQAFNHVTFHVTYKLMARFQIWLSLEGHIAEESNHNPR